MRTVFAATGLTAATAVPEVPVARFAGSNRARFGSVEELLADARSGLDRLDPRQVAAALADGARLVDIRPAWQRAAAGEIPGALVVERNHLEWRLHPGSAARLDAARPGQRWIVLCNAGYTSSLAAAALVSLGVPATDLIGGIEAWRAAGLPVVPGPTPIETVVGAAGGTGDAARVQQCVPSLHS